MVLKVGLNQAITGLAQKGISKKVANGYFKQIKHDLLLNPNETYEELGKNFQKLSLPEFVNVSKNVKSVPFFKLKGLILAVSSSRKIKRTTTLEQMVENQKRWNKEYPVLMNFLTNITVPQKYTVEAMKVGILIKQDAKAAVAK